MADELETRFQEVLETRRARFARLARAYAPGADAQDRTGGTAFATATRR